MSSTESSLKIKIVKSDYASGGDSEGDYRISQNQLCKIQKAETPKKTYDFRMKSTMKSIHLDKKQMKFARKKIAETSKSLFALITKFKNNSVHMQESSNTFNNDDAVVKTKVFWDGILQPIKSSLQTIEPNHEHIKKKCFDFPKDISPDEPKLIKKLKSNSAPVKNISQKKSPAKAKSENEFQMIEEKENTQQSTNDSIQSYGNSPINQVEKPQNNETAFQTSQKKLPNFFNSPINYFFPANNPMILSCCPQVASPFPPMQLPQSLPTMRNAAQNFIVVDSLPIQQNSMGAPYYLAVNNSFANRVIPHNQSFFLNLNATPNYIINPFTTTFISFPN